jgi:hypothetical protein
MYKENRFIKTPDELHRIMQAFKIAPENEIGEFIVGQTEKIIELERHIGFLTDVIETQKKQIERLQLVQSKKSGRYH